MLSTQTVEQIAARVITSPESAEAISLVKLAKESLADPDAIDRMTENLGVLLAAAMTTKFSVPLNDWPPPPLDGCLITSDSEIEHAIALKAIARAEQLVNRNATRWNTPVLVQHLHEARVDEFMHDHVTMLVAAGMLGQETYTALCIGNEPTKDKKRLEHYVTMDATEGLAGPYKPRVVFVAESLSLPQPEEDLAWALRVFALDSDQTRRHMNTPRHTHHPTFPVLIAPSFVDRKHFLDIGLLSPRGGTLNISFQRKTSARTGEEYLSWVDDQRKANEFAENGKMYPWSIPLE